MSTQLKPRERLSRWLSNLWRVVRESLTRNLPLKLISLALAFVVWPILMITTDPMRTRPVNNVVIQVEGEDYFQDVRHFALVEDIYALIRTVDVDVSVLQSERAVLGNASVRATIDLTQVSKTGEQDIPINVTSTIGTVVKTTPDHIRVTVEPRKRQIVSVRVNPTDPLPDGYREIDAPTLTPASLTVWGAESVVSQIQYALVDLSYEAVAGGTYNYSVSDDAVFVNAADAPVRYAETLDVDGGSTNVTVRGRILPTAEKPILLGKGSFDGNPADGYELRTEGGPFEIITSVDPQTVEVAAPRDVLEALEYVTFEPINISGWNDSQRRSAAVNRPADAEWVSQEQVSVYASIVETLGTRAFDNLDLHIRGLKEGTSLDYDTDIRVRAEITAGKIHLDDVRHEQVIAFLDLSDYNTAGVYDVPVQVEVEGLNYYNPPAIDTQSVQVTIRAREET